MMETDGVSTAAMTTVWSWRGGTPTQATRPTSENMIGESAAAARSGPWAMIVRTKGVAAGDALWSQNAALTGVTAATTPWIVTTALTEGRCNDQRTLL